MAKTLFKAAFGAFVLFSPLMTSVASGQDRPRPIAEFTAGWVAFPDDGIAGEGMVGLGGRWHLLPRVSVGPEVVYISGDNHSHLMVTGNVTWDLLRPINGQLRAVTPFLVVGGGLFQTRERFFSETFTSSEGAFTAGGGVRATAGDRMTFGIDARVGWELHLRINGVVGLRLGN